MSRRGKEARTYGELEKHLLKCEKWGVLDRHIVYHSIPLDSEEGTGKLVPPRLLFLYRTGHLYHCYGDEAFYDAHPEYEKGKLSYECLVLDEAPRHLSNYLAQEAVYRNAGFIDVGDDLLHMRTRRPARLTRADIQEINRYAKQQKQAAAKAYRDDQKAKREARKLAAASPVVRVVK